MIPHAPSRVAHALRLVATVIAVGSMTALAGCASGTTPETTNTASSTETISYTYGTFSAQIPANPERVVVLDSRGALEFAILAGYPIVATAYNEDSHLNQYLPDDVGEIVGETEPSKEAILAYDPDLLVVSKSWADYYDKQGITIDDLAPVLVIETPDGTVDGAEALAIATEQLSLLDRETGSTDSIAEYGAALLDAQETHGDTIAGRTIALVGLSETGWWALTDPSELTVRLASDLGYTILDNEAIQAAEAANTSAGSAILSWEQADALSDADLIFAQNLDTGEGIDAWQRVPAVAAGHVASLDYDDRSGFALTHLDFLAKLVTATTTLGS